MHIHIQASSVNLTEPLRKFIERKLIQSLSDCQHRLQQVVVKLSDNNRADGVIDKQCLVQVVVPGVPDVMIEDTEPNIYAAIDRATDRASLVVNKTVAPQKLSARHGRPLRRHLMGA
jgi:putative sigma-54 modulation protein